MIRSTESVKAYAEENGLEFHVPHASQLFIDLDSYSAVKEFEKRVSFFMAVHPSFIERILYTESRSGGCHAYVNLCRAVTPMERACLQSILGSDPKREILSLKDLYTCEREPVVFFEKPVTEYRYAAIKPGNPLDRLEKFILRVRKIWNRGRKHRPKNINHDPGDISSLEDEEIPTPGTTGTQWSNSDSLSKGYR